MAKTTTDFLGILPSLEVLPFFSVDLKQSDNGKTSGAGLPFEMKAHSSYGDIARNMLTRKIMGGVIPWEIFISDVLALPGQRTCWQAPLFLQECPTELALRESVFRAFYPPASASRSKLPTKLTVGVESLNSLTKAQMQEWLRHWGDNESIELSFCMLPMDLLIKALQAETIDAMIAATPWGMYAETAGFGHVDTRFIPGKYAQKVVVLCHRDFVEANDDLANTLRKQIAAARMKLRDPVEFCDAASRMSGCGKPWLEAELLSLAAKRHSYSRMKKDIVPDVKILIEELASLGTHSVLPAHISPDEQVARLLHAA
ncbi:MAG: hypothetical protein RL693_692 [Verrucomicrobiota bacterium]